MATTYKEMSIRSSQLIFGPGKQSRGSSYVNLVDAINSWIDQGFITVAAGGDAVTSVAGYTGVVVLDTDDITEASNLYFTDVRSIASPITGFTSGAAALTATDSILEAIQKLDGNIGNIATLATADQVLTGPRVISGTDTNTLEITTTDGSAVTQTTHDGAEINTSVAEGGITSEINIGGNVTINSFDGADSTSIAVDTTNIDIQFAGASDFKIDNDAGTAGYVFTSGGAGNAPTWSAIAVAPTAPTTSAAGNYTVLTTDKVILKTGITGGGDTVTMPAAPTTGQIFIIKDASGTATTNNITVDTSGAPLIDGSATLIINGNYNAVTLQFDGVNYFILSKV